MMSESLKSSSSNSIVLSHHEICIINRNNNNNCTSQSLTSAFADESEVDGFFSLLTKFLTCQRKTKSNFNDDKKYVRKNWLCCGVKNNGCHSKQHPSTSSSSHCSNEYTPSPRCSYNRPDDPDVLRVHSKTLPNSKCTKIVLKKCVISTQTLPKEAKYANTTIEPGTSNAVSIEVDLNSTTTPSKNNPVVNLNPSVSATEDVTVQSYQTPVQPSNTSVSSNTLPPLYDQVRESSNDCWSLSKELEKLTRYGWYWGPITRVEAEEKLANQPDGTFLVRDSSDDRYLLSLSFRSYGRTLHTRIEHCNGMFSLYTQTESEGYRSIIELIEHSVSDSQTGIFCYSRARTPGSLSFPVRLTKPVSRFAKVRSLQYLCRFLIRESIRLDHIRQLPLPSAMKDFLEERPY